MDLDKQIDVLISLGADIEHLDGTLLEHLKGTYRLLISWRADPDLCMAGLYHAVYGTSGFERHLIASNQRQKIKKMIGEKAEHIVYQYCACDRNSFWPQIGVNSNPIFFDRLIDKKYHLTMQELQWFCELTAANEREIARDNQSFVEQYGASLEDLFLRMKPYISTQATDAISEVFNKNL